MLNCKMMNFKRMRTELRENRNSMSKIRACTSDKIHEGPKLLLIEICVNSGFIREETDAAAGISDVAIVNDR